MEINIREHIRNNFKGTNLNEIKDSIVESIDSKDEVVLPGLGVFFEILWNGSDEKEKDTIVSIILNHI